MKGNNFMRHPISRLASVMVLVLLLTGTVSGQDDKKDSPRENGKAPKLVLPRHWNKLDLTGTQKDDLLKIQTDFKAKVAASAGEVKKSNARFAKLSRQAALIKLQPPAIQKQYEAVTQEFEKAREQLTKQLDEHKKLKADYAAAMEKVLSESQKTRLLALNTIDLLPRNWEKLSLTDEQLARLNPPLTKHLPVILDLSTKWKEAQAKQFALLNEAQSNAHGSGSSTKQAQNKMGLDAINAERKRLAETMSKLLEDKNNEERAMLEEMLKELTDGQKSRLQELTRRYLQGR